MTVTEIVNNLNPCPNCGCNSIYLYSTTPLKKEEREYYIQCPKCTDTTLYYSNPDEAISNWNKTVTKEIINVRPCPFCGKVPTIEDLEITVNALTGCFAAFGKLNCPNEENCISGPGVWVDLYEGHLDLHEMFGAAVEAWNYRGCDS